MRIYNNLISGSDNSKLEDTQEINLGHSRLDLNHEIEEVVLLKSQNPSSSIGQERRGTESPLSKALFGNELNTGVSNQELDELRVRVLDFQHNYVKKDYLIDLIDKLHETLVMVEVDASNLKDIMKNFQTNSSVSSTSDYDT